VTSLQFARIFGEIDLELGWRLGFGFFLRKEERDRSGGIYREISWPRGKGTE
jgi:hypothetical protein